MEGDILSQILRSWMWVDKEEVALAPPFCKVVSILSACFSGKKRKIGKVCRFFCVCVSLGGFIKLSRESNVFLAVGCFL